MRSAKFGDVLVERHDPEECCQSTWREEGSCNDCRRHVKCVTCKADMAAMSDTYFECVYHSDAGGLFRRAVVCTDHECIGACVASMLLFPTAEVVAEVAR